ncbi:MAG: fibronectin type III domain-containing protein [Thermodesulfobacteriota bacterium]
MTPRHLLSASLSLVCLLGVAATQASAQTLTRGPLIQNPAALTTTMTIVWWTDVAGNGTVEYGTTPALGQSVTVPQAGSCEIGAAGTCHVVPLTGLAPGTRYYYRLLTNGVQVKATTYFRTFPAPGDPSELFFTVVGDFGSGQSQASNVAANQDAVDPPLVMTVGDNAYENGTLSDWDNKVFIPQYDSLLSRAVFMPSLGNHDLNDVGASNWAQSAEIRLHHLPRNAPAGQEERYFSFDYGDAHFVVLDSNPPALNSTQTAWLEADLAATDRKWIFVFHHIASHSCANGIASFGSNMTVRNLWGHLFEEYGVDVVFEGHDHIYERSQAVDEYVVGGGAGSDGLTTVYVMSGGGGKTLDAAASSDSGGAYRDPLFGSKSYCPWLANDCPNGVGGQWCSFARYQHTEVRIENNDTLTVTAVDQNDQVFDVFTLVKDAQCGDGVPQTGEECDQDAANGTTGSCCTADCEVKPSGTVCRASAGVCDLAESCNGSSAQCPADSKSTAVCRNPAGVCDVAESCNGTSNACPADAKAPAGTQCRAASGTCDVAEACDGSSVACPTDVFVASGTECRAAAGDCDLAEACTGVSPACPADALAGAGVECRAAAGACDVAETCTGASVACPADTLRPGGTPCRGSTGACDPAESCTGTSASCPADQLSPAGTQCRAAASTCDVAESCTGSGVACPADSGLPDGDEDGVCDASDRCPDVEDPTQADADGDGLGDACDPCSNFLPVVIAKPSLVVSKLATLPGDDKLRFTGSLTIPGTPAIDPASDGFRLILTGLLDAPVLDVTVPGGIYDPLTRAGWTVNSRATTYTYRNAGIAVPLVGGINRVTLKKSPRTPGLVTFSISAKNGSYPVGASSLPLFATLVLDPPFAAGNQCGEVDFAAPGRICTFATRTGIAKCK